MARCLFVMMMSLSITFASPSAGAEASESRFLLRFEPGSGTVEVVGLLPSELNQFTSQNHPPEFWTERLSIRVARDPGQPEAAPIVGQHQVIGGTLRFLPRYPFLAGTRYVARFEPGRIGPAGSGVKPLILTFTKSKEPPGRPTEVVAVYPTSDVLPENLLKLYLSFSEPMSRGEVYRRVSLLEGSGRQVERPFLELGEELWNPQMTRVTLLFDPGRIKRGLKPREEEGPILEEGKSYTLVIDRAWPDAKGQPLSRETRKSFRASSPDQTQPVVNRWTFEAPRQGTRDPLIVRFPEPLDQAMLSRAIQVKVNQSDVAGRIVLGNRERLWTFVPEAPWKAGSLTLLIDPELEDLAGNSLERPFEVDLIHPQTTTLIKRKINVPLTNYR